MEPVVLFQEVDFLRPTTCELSWDRRIVWSSRVGRLSVSGSNSGSSTGSGTAGTRTRCPLRFRVNQSWRLWDSPCAYDLSMPRRMGNLVWSSAPPRCCCCCCCHSRLTNPAESGQRASPLWTQICQCHTLLSPGPVYSVLRTYAKHARYTQVPRHHVPVSTCTHAVSQVADTGGAAF